MASGNGKFEKKNPFSSALFCRISEEASRRRAIDSKVIYGEHDFNNS